MKSIACAVGAIRRGGAFTAAMVLVAGLMILAACGSSIEAAPILTIDEALAVEDGSDVKVQGLLLATGDEQLLASVLLESYPPQAGGSTLGLKGLDLEALAGLSSSADQPDLAQRTWSDFPIVLGGVIDQGVLEVTETPPVAEVAAAGATVRFSPTSEPLASGSEVHWVFEVTNTSDGLLTMTFSSGQMGEVVFSRDGTELYRWSTGRLFTQAVQETALEPGKSMHFILADTLGLEPGVYEVTALVTAKVGPEGSGQTLAEIKSTSTIR